jgi:hypothetical protein
MRTPIAFKDDLECNDWWLIGKLVQRDVIEGRDDKAVWLMFKRGFLLRWAFTQPAFWADLGGPNA